MQVIPSRRAPRPRASSLPTFASVLIGVVLLGVGLGLGYLAFSTSIVARVMGSARPGPIEVALGITTWAVALTAPACLIVLGLGRLAHAAGPLRKRPSRSISSLVGTLTDDYVGATRVQLPDAHVIPELVIGPHGVAIFEELPPPAVSRQGEGQWEVRMTDGRWIPIENPLARATRDAERVRRWLATDDHDFVVKVYAAVIGSDPRVARTPTCAVITRDEIPAFLASLPPQRSLTRTRLQRIVEQVDAAV